jgi:hypothetical protein
MGLKHLTPLQSQFQSTSGPADADNLNLRHRAALSSTLVSLPGSPLPPRVNATTSGLLHPGWLPSRRKQQHSLNQSASPTKTSILNPPSRSEVKISCGFREKHPHHQASRDYRRGLKRVALAAIFAAVSVLFSEASAELPGPFSCMARPTAVLRTVTERHEVAPCTHRRRSPPPKIARLAPLDPTRAPNRVRGLAEPDRIRMRSQVRGGKYASTVDAILDGHPPGH